ncbi:MAG: hypothetical protein AB8G05_01315 [Oligoflexales bacterium]
MKISSAKQKGRRASAEVQQALLDAYPVLKPDDVRITPSSVNGPDLMLSTYAQFILPFEFEVKNQERLNIFTSLEQAKGHGDGIPLVVFKKNRSKLHVALEFDEFLKLISG